MTDDSAAAHVRSVLRQLRDETRRSISTEPEHAIPHHRADEFLRDILEDVLHEGIVDLRAEWAAMSPEERAQAREGSRRTPREPLTPEGRAEGPTIVPSAQFDADTRGLTVYTDGSQRANGNGGWAWWVNDELCASGSERFTTNQVMELWACVEAIGAFGPDVPLRVVSDSAYVVNCFHERWFDDWRTRGWRNSRKEPVANRALWEELLATVEAHRAPIEWVHIRGHGKANSRGERPDPAHVHGNDQADRLATAASAALGA